MEVAEAVQILPVPMTSLPIPAESPETEFEAPGNSAAISHSANRGIGNPGLEDGQFLLRAFRTFSQAAASLERSYHSLQSESACLRGELEKSNAGLARSLEENRRIRGHLDCVLESLPCGVLVVSGDGKITRLNPEARRLLGIVGEIQAESVAQLVPGLSILFERARKQEAEAEIGDPGQATGRWLSARHARLTEDEAGSSVFILQDVSERKQLERAQQRLRREQALAEISATLAHEIRNPLQSLELFAGLLAESELTRECKGWVDHLQAGLRILGATVNNVLHFHSLPAPECAPVDLGRWLDWAQQFLMPLMREAGIELRVEHALAGVDISADRHRLEQVLLNLVLNSVRALPGGGRIEISGGMMPETSAVRIAVADTGPGISPQHLARVFEPGFSTRAGSPGLGLAVCRKIVEQHRGTIRAGNCPGSGAKFTLIFPLGPYTTGETGE